MAVTSSGEASKPTTELQDLTPPTGLTVDVSVEDGRFVLGDSPGVGLTVDEAVVANVVLSSTSPVRAGPHIRPANAGSRLDTEPPR
jgi:hypothetical protein